MKHLLLVTLCSLLVSLAYCSLTCPPCVEERIIVDKDAKCLEWYWIEVDKDGNPINSNILRENYPIGGPNLIQKVATQKVVDGSNTIAAIISVSVVGSLIALVLVICSIVAIGITIGLCIRYRKKQFINKDTYKGEIAKEILMASRDPQLERTDDNVILLQPRTSSTDDEEFEDD